MRQTLIDEVNRMADRVDAVFLGYGICQSLEGIEEDCDILVMLPTADDCISLMMGSDTYAEEVKKEVGTWFMTPGWAKVGIDMVIRELRLERTRGDCALLRDWVRRAREWPPEHPTPLPSPSVQ